MKEIETLVEEKSKESSDLAMFVKDDINPASTPETANKRPFDDIAITLTSSALNGSQRVVLDGVTTSDECQEIQRLSSTEAIQSGFKATLSPHSVSEMFQDISILKALQEGLVPLMSARLFSDLSEKIRNVLESYFVLESPLYLSSSNLVCRSAIAEKQEERTDCLLISELNSCIKELSAYSDQGYSAILYLNDDFEGGDFIFTESDAKSVSAVVKPQCGRVVGYRAGPENLHGVTAVTKGQRCAVVLRFTLDPHHSEKERLEVEELLKKLSSSVEADLQKTEMDSNTKSSEHEETVSAKTTEEETIKSSTSTEHPSKATEENKTDSKVLIKSEKPNAKASKKKTKTQTKAKADKTKSKVSDKTKTTTAEKKKSKTPKTKPVTSDEKKKADKATVKNTAKPKSTEPKDSTAENHKDEL